MWMESATHIHAYKSVEFILKRSNSASLCMAFTVMYYCPYLEQPTLQSQRQKISYFPIYMNSYRCHYSSDYLLLKTMF